ncbi:dynein regulatory complex subunit 2 [Sabethes cyaneus]|uniref:dynein regulatory complex subunit 2 n=1 Tax=Sabethes cyaneus TaxID=53552 RepID=UPI00237D44BE|nr:dynein regulatory complex subunit 2 [Sabethes cyaneus]
MAKRRPPLRTVPASAFVEMSLETIRYNNNGYAMTRPTVVTREKISNVDLKNATLQLSNLIMKLQQQQQIENLENRANLAGNGNYSLDETVKKLKKLFRSPEVCELQSPRDADVRARLISKLEADENAAGDVGKVTLENLVEEFHRVVNFKLDSPMVESKEERNIEFLGQIVDHGKSFSRRFNPQWRTSGSHPVTIIEEAKDEASSIPTSKPSGLDEPKQQSMNGSNPNGSDKPTVGFNLKKLRKLERLQAKRLAAEELKRQTIRDQLKREQNFSLQTEKRVFEQWEQMCSDVQYQSIWEDMLQIQQYIQPRLDRKNFCIERLLTSRTEIEDIYSRNLQRLKKLIQCYLDIHAYFRDNLSQQYEKDCKNLLDEFRRDALLKESHGNECTLQMEGAIISLEDAMEQGLLDDRVDFIKKNDETINTHIEKRDRLRDKKLDHLQQLHGEIKSVVKNYLTTILHPEKAKAYFDLYGTDEASQQLITGNRVKIKQLRETIRHLNRKIIEVDIAGNRRVITKRFAKRKLETDLDSHKRTLAKLEVDHKDRMKELSYNAFHVQTHLDQLLGRGKLILGLARNCSKLECDDDKKYFERRVKQGRTATNCPAEYEFFFDKINRVEAINLLLAAERDKLQQTNRELQDKFKEYCKLNNPKADSVNLQLVATNIFTSEKPK